MQACTVILGIYYILLGAFNYLITQSSCVGCSLIRLGYWTFLLTGVSNIMDGFGSGSLCQSSLHFVLRCVVGIIDWFFVLTSAISFLFSPLSPLPSRVSSLGDYSMDGPILGRVQ